MYRAAQPPTKNTVHILYMVPRLPTTLDDSTKIFIVNHH
jgi:hypothetical protein